MLIPSIDWKKSFNRSLTHAWGSKAHLSLMVKIQTRRLYFSCWHILSETEAAVCIMAGDSAMELARCSPWFTLPAGPPITRGEMRGCLSSQVCPSLHWICLAYSIYVFRLGCRTLNWVQQSGVSGITLDVTQTLCQTIKQKAKQIMMHLQHETLNTWAGTHPADQGRS